MRVVRAADRVTMPWRNGGGVTHELWREDGAAGFALRLSIAEVASDGPFSRFPGVDRILLMLRGDGFVLTRGDGLTVRFDRPGVPFPFHGEDDWICALVAGPVLDFNVMVDRTRWRAAVETVTLAGPLVLHPAERAFALPLDPVDLDGAGVGPHELAAVVHPVTVTGAPGARVVVVRCTSA